MAEPILELNNVTVRRGMGVVLQDFSMTVNAGECVVLHGANGVGKSTIIETAARLLPMENGSVKHHGKVVCDGEGRRNKPLKPFGLTLTIQLPRSKSNSSTAIGQCGRLIRQIIRF